MKTIYSPILTCIQADYLFLCSEDGLTAWPALKAYDLLYEILEKCKFDIKADARNQIIACESLDVEGPVHYIYDAKDASYCTCMVIATCQALPDVCVHFIMEF